MEIEGKKDDAFQNENINNNIEHQDNLFLIQENRIINNYNEKKNRIQNYFNMMYERYYQSQEFYEFFINLIKDYKESKLNNIQSLTNILNKYFHDDNKDSKKAYNNQINTIIKEFKEIIKIQIKCEKDKINQLDLDFSKNIEEDIKTGKKLLDNLNNLYNSYMNSIEEIKKQHLEYLEYFNSYEIKLINEVESKLKNTKNQKENNNNDSSEDINKNININNEIKKNANIIDSLFYQNEPNEFNEMTKKLLEKEKKYKKLLKNYDEDIHPLYLKFKQYISDLSGCHKEFNELENQLFTVVYLGFIVSIQSQHNYQEKVLNFENLIKINYQDCKELNHLFETINFENYKTVFIYSNKDDYHSCKDLPPEYVIEISKIINSKFPYIPKLDIGDYEEPNYKIIKIVTEKMLNNEIISENEENTIINVLKKKKYRLIFLRKINSFRANGKFILTNENLIILGNIIRTIIDLFDMNNKDYDVLNLLIIMSQTYYTLNYKKKKIYLIRFIEDHHLFESEELWSFYIEESIKRDIIEKEKTNLENGLILDEETRNMQINNIYFSVLLSITQNILEFQIPKDTIMKLMTNLIDKKYKLIPVYIEQIFSLIEETKYENRNKFDVNIDILGKESKKNNK